MVLSLILFVNQTNKSFAMEYGHGELKLSDYAVEGFIRFIKGDRKNSPYLFSVAIDGLAYTYWICSEGLNRCRDGNHRTVNRGCLKYSKKYGSGAKCAVFAHNRTIKWDNQINKKAKINSKWSDSEIRAKLTELGFLGEATSTEEKVSTTNEGNTVEQLKTLTKLYESGNLTKEEFEKAKKKILGD